MSGELFAFLHSMENLAQRGHEQWEHLQVITHRFNYFPGQLLPENGLSTLRAAAERGLRNHEFDIVVTRENGAIVDHDFSPLRTTGIKGSYRKLLQKDIAGKPILVRQFRHNDFAPTGTHSGDTVMTFDDFFEQARKIVPTGTFMADCRNDDIADFAARISKSSQHDNILLMFYTFTISSGPELVEKIEKKEHYSGWRKRVKLVLNLYPSELITLAVRYHMPANTVADFVEVGKVLLMSLANEGVPLFALLVMCSGVDPLEIKDMHIDEVRRAVNAELAIVEVVKWARTYGGFENLKIGTGTRAYDVSLPLPDGTREFYTYDLKTGDLVPWPALAGLRMIKQLYATPGRAEEAIKPDFICTDVPERAHFHCCGVAADASNGFEHPRFDAVTKEEAA
ncbi:glycerophosphodiester phosphodiesterase family protein [Mesorhizobium sp. GbtcB19]|uniref:glycerophosphodiester phosphodiesterase family protein n=1 Tax=Mesorhizobium sp. GbtcB19 TaxID=2824764 RepID=UPI001C30C050|nr:glycerophosphodiester phosphodiesterase family protein [Mesorhizobium sp. GbtcB19]